MTTKTTKTTRKPKFKAKPSRRSKKPAATTTSMVIQALCRPESATVTELMELTSWQNHSVRGFLSGTAKQKLGLTIERMTEDGRTVYRVPSVPADGRSQRREV